MSTEADSFPEHTSPRINTKTTKQRLTRSQVACDWCHAYHARCDRVFPCSRCLRIGAPCELTLERRKRGRPRQGILNTNTTTYDDDHSSSTDAPSLLVALTPSSTVSSVQTPNTFLNSLFTDLPTLETMAWPTQHLETNVDSTADILPLQSIPSDINDLPSLAMVDDASFQLELFYPENFTDDRSLIPSDLGSRATSTPCATKTSLRHPVLQPLMPFIEDIISPELSCGLLEHYFSSAYPTRVHPVCLHIHCYVLRKESFVGDYHSVCSPALLASILGVAAADDNALSLPMSSRYRKKTCRFLSSLTLDLLEPLKHNPFRERSDNSLSDILYPTRHTEGICEPVYHCSATGRVVHNHEHSTGSLDDVIAYIHTASIISASEQQALSMRWWHAAITMARELRLNREIETLESVDSMSFTGSLPQSPPLSTQILDCVCSRVHDSSLHITEEQREERRRVWWLLYMMDRHLAIYANRPLLLLDSESKDLLLPLDEESWQAGDIHSNSPRFNGPQGLFSGHHKMRRIFPGIAIYDQSIFGFYLPLMVIMGQVVDLHRIETHPILGPGVLKNKSWLAQHQAVRRQLKQYEVSLSAFNPNNRDIQASTSPQSVDSSSDLATSQEYTLSTQTAIAYASYYVHVFHILLQGMWDPVSLSEDRYLWASSPSLAFTIPHAIKAANSVREVLKLDPDIRFMPRLFGVHLLHGSFRYLFIIESLQTQAGETLLEYCEAMIRATESCFTTTKTEHQRLFCQVVRSAVAQARGRPVNYWDICRRHRAILILRNWTDAGTGLTL